MSLASKQTAGSRFTDEFLLHALCLTATQIQFKERLDETPATFNVSRGHRGTPGNSCEGGLMFVAAMKQIPSDYCELTEGFQKVVKRFVRSSKASAAAFRKVSSMSLPDQTNQQTVNQTESAIFTAPRRHSAASSPRSSSSHRCSPESQLAALSALTR